MLLHSRFLDGCFCCCAPSGPKPKARMLGSRTQYSDRQEPNPVPLGHVNMLISISQKQACWLCYRCCNIENLLPDLGRLTC